MDATALLSLAGGMLIAIIWHDDLMAVGERIGRAVGEAIVWGLFGE